MIGDDEGVNDVGMSVVGNLYVGKRLGVSDKVVGAAEGREVVGPNVGNVLGEFEEGANEGNRVGEAVVGEKVVGWQLTVTNVA